MKNDDQLHRVEILANQLERLLWAVLESFRLYGRVSVANTKKEGPMDATSEAILDYLWKRWVQSRRSADLNSIRNDIAASRGRASRKTIRKRLGELIERGYVTNQRTESKSKSLFRLSDALVDSVKARFGLAGPQSDTLSER